ncbi:hypothetical protein JTE90_012015 [Oedothorax gibbosus]|uniref:Cytochrome P450 n=1 Tax=Oedothorax gibbosus TaxID=931172 RepID=A0AAV6TZR5_9ARAC|nr:hypothetical protein JTE90_012015 [Oedothorax gibbosus]KAG8177133.1 hypothetical protein JTE90_012015 [Oedothorax gibbosus]KAG8177134.1 hypothetical protein JTE90_012015 [Oedothorax gibbosus]
MQHLPGHKFSTFNVFGNLLDFSFRSESRNGFHFNVNVLQILNGFSEVFRKDNLYCIWFSYVPFVIVNKAKAVEELLSGNKMIEKSQSYDFLHPWLGEGLLTSGGSKWKSRRKLLTPSFHFEILKEFLPIFNEQSQKETDKEFTDIVLPITLCSLDIICETTLGVSIRAQDNKDSQYVKSVASAGEIVMERSINLFLWPDFIFYNTNMGREFKKHLKILHGFTRMVIQEKKKKLLCGVSDTSKRKRKALMDVLLEHHLETKKCTEEDVREEVDTFAFEGHDTTSLGVSWALYLIGLNKDVQAKLQEEMDRIFGDDIEREITTEDLNDMKYLECVLKESQRLYPSVPFFARYITEDFQMCGYTLPKGSSCFVLSYSLHRDKDVFPNPEKFDPDRFLPENCIDRNPYAYVPFSAGSRNCIGQRFALMEEKVIVSSILRNFTLESLDTRDKVLPVPELILKPSRDMRIKIRKRNRNGQ